MAAGSVVLLRRVDRAAKSRRDYSEFVDWLRRQYTAPDSLLLGVRSVKFTVGHADRGSCGRVTLYYTAAAEKWQRRATNVTQCEARPTHDAATPPTGRPCQPLPSSQ
ncbi:hypothetical protein J6590_091393 [Homalodisca vitripennis]|nr:hypothetical protein J6590_091393 [Homalodisca vitripennis]